MYRLSPSGVTRLDDGVAIQRGAPGWPAYLTWLAAGGIPQAMPPGPAPELPNAVPQSVTRFRALAALHAAGLLAQVEAVVSTLDPLAQLAWDEAATYRRDSPILLAVARQIGLTGQQVDDLFRQAAALQL